MVGLGGLGARHVTKPTLADASTYNAMKGKLEVRLSFWEPVSKSERMFSCSMLHRKFW